MARKRDQDPIQKEGEKKKRSHHMRIEQKEVVASQQGRQYFIAVVNWLFTQPYHCTIDRSE
jgi:hypothetical protein